MQGKQYKRWQMRPEKREEAQLNKEKKQALIEKQELAQKKLKEAFIETAGSPYGKLVLRWLMQECGFKAVSIVGNPQTGDIQDRGTLYNEARRNIWITMRQRIPTKLRNKIEADKEEK